MIQILPTQIFIIQRPACIINTSHWSGFQRDVPQTRNGLLLVLNYPVHIKMNCVGKWLATKNKQDETKYKLYRHLFITISKAAEANHYKSNSIKMQTVLKKSYLR